MSVVFPVDDAVNIIRRRMDVSLPDSSVRIPTFKGRRCSRGVWGAVKDVPESVQKIIRDPAKLVGLLSDQKNPLLDVYVDDGRTRVFVDDSRKALLRDLMEIVNDLVDGESHGQELCRVLLGQRGVGKTYFLSAFMAAMQLQADKDFIVVTVCCKDVDVEEVEPIVAIRNSLVDLGHDEPPVWRTCTDMNRWLLERNLRIVLMYNEVEALYLEAGGNRARALRQLHAIGNYSVNRSIVTFVTGSDSHLPRLLFRKMVDADLTSWPGYCGSPDMNCRKYICKRVSLSHSAACRDFS